MRCDVVQVLYIVGDVCGPLFTDRQLKCGPLVHRGWCILLLFLPTVADSTSLTMLSMRYITGDVVVHIVCDVMLYNYCTSLAMWKCRPLVHRGRCILLLLLPTVANSTSLTMLSRRYIVGDVVVYIADDVRGRCIFLLLLEITSQEGAHHWRCCRAYHMRMRWCILCCRV